MTNKRTNKTIRMNEKERALLSELCEILQSSERDTIMRALRFFKKMIDSGKIKIY